MSFDAKHVMLNVPVALTEALSNAILRGNREDPEKRVHVRALVTALQLVMEVKDEGLGFDIEGCTRDPTRPENVEREDGRGLFLMRSLMDSVERYDQDGNVVRLTLNRR
jgi:serine/threonine-protein kinase RsbW